METATVSVYAEVESRLVGVIDKATPDVGEIEQAVEELESEFGSEIHSSLLYLLCHLEFPPEEARSHWQSALEHRREMTGKMGTEVDLRVAVLDYFISVNQHLQSPKILQIQIFPRTQNSAIRDELTGLYNHRYFRSELEREISRAERSKESLSLVFLDVDYFKWYNDRNGHLAGDRALAEIARAIRDVVRETDLAARYGGEEFAVILPAANKAHAHRVAERIREAVSLLPVPHASEQPSGRFTISGGVVTFRADAADADGLVDAADRALYLAKGRGKNQIISSGNQREFPRVDVRITGRLQRVSSQRDPLLTHNLSEQGMRFQCETALHAGDFFHFGMTLPDTGREIEGLGKTVRSRKRGASSIVQAEIVEISMENARALKEYLDRR